MAKKLLRRRAFFAGMLAAKRLPLSAPIPKGPYSDPVYAGDFRLGFVHFRNAGSLKAAGSTRKVG